MLRERGFPRALIWAGFRGRCRVLTIESRNQRANGHSACCRKLPKCCICNRLRIFAALGTVAAIALANTLQRWCKRAARACVIGKSKLNLK